MVFHDTINTGITPNDGQGDGLRTNIRKLHDNTKDNKQRLDELNGNIPGVMSSNGVTVLSPLDAVFSENSGGVLGAFKITLPQYFSSTMMKLFVEIYDYSNNESISLIISGYNYISNSEWVNTSVQLFASKADRNFPVRFGHDGSKCCVYIGELNSHWTFPKLAVTKCFLGFSNISSSEWLTGWNISLETSVFQNITSHHTNNFPVAQ